MDSFNFLEAADQTPGGMFGDVKTPSNPTWPGAPQPSTLPQPSWPPPGGQPSTLPQPSSPHPGGQSSNLPQPSSPPPGGYGGPAQNLTIPYWQDLPYGLSENTMITICGTIKPNASRITVDLKTQNDLVFHFNPRFNEGGRKVIVRNSYIGKVWGKEERECCSFPFECNRQFEMKILCTSAGFKVAVNNSHLLEFKHRVHDLRSINRLDILYDLILTRVDVSRV